MIFICMDHNFECRGRENMKAHIRTHKIFRCNEHNFECRVAENMKAHIRSHLKDLNRFDCTQCSYHTSNKGALAEHIKSHRPFWRAITHSSPCRGTRRAQGSMASPLAAKSRTDAIIARMPRFVTTTWRLACSSTTSPLLYLVWSTACWLLICKIVFFVIKFLVLYLYRDQFMTLC